MEKKPSAPINSGQTGGNKNLNSSIQETRVVEVKLESEEFAVEDVKPSTEKKM